MADWYERQKISRKEKYEELKKMASAYGAGKKKQLRVLQVVKRAEINCERKQIKAQSNKTTDTFKDIYEEVTKYNEEHGTNYSYGYYSALKFRGLI